MKLLDNITIFQVSKHIFTMNMSNTNHFQFHSQTFGGFFL